ncbi:MAG TPA: endolytic transglycosylase MltG [Methylocystis sp.]|nr:endolytic transglycosylase MltG [Methylocystis sp.]
MTSESDNDERIEKAGTDNASPPETASSQQATTQGAPPSPATPTPPPKPEKTSGFWRFWRRRSVSREESQARQRRTRVRRRRRQGSLSLLSDGFSFVLVALVAGIFGLVSIRHVLNEPGPLRADKIVYFPPRTDALEMISQLEREGVVDNPTLMNVTLLVENKIGKVKPGEYLFKQAASIRDVIDVLVSGRQVLHAVTIPEGLTSEQIAQRLRDNDILAGEILETPKEGALLPETYKVTRGFQRSKLLAKMQDDLKKLVDQIWARRRPDLPIHTPYELVTLASIVEKETGKTEERPMVAAVFVNRLRKKMRLQSDPTIVYGLVGGKATLGRPIQRSEIEKFTPYNTYAIDGLPPGPVANPGRASLEAAANPAQTNDLYFVADGTGGHVFAQTLEQHNRNVQHWREIEHERNAPSDVDHGAPSLTQPSPPPPASDVKEKHGDAGAFGRLLAAPDPAPEYPHTRELRPDAGAALRLGRFGSRAGLLEVGALDEPTRSEAVAELRPARAFLFLAAMQEGALRAEDAPLSSLTAESLDDADLHGAGSLAGGLPEDRVERGARLDVATADVDGAATERPHGRRIIDASQGTRLDPLLDKSWDLNSPKTVPVDASLR